MKIRNRLYISAGISIILVVILLSSVLVTSGRIAEGNKKLELSCFAFPLPNFCVTGEADLQKKGSNSVLRCWNPFFAIDNLRVQGNQFTVKVQNRLCSPKPERPDGFGQLQKRWLPPLARGIGFYIVSDKPVAR